MRILLINPNTTEAVTEQAAAHVRRLIPAEIVPATGRFGARYISSRAAAAIAGHAALDALAAMTHEAASRPDPSRGPLSKLRKRSLGQD